MLAGQLTDFSIDDIFNLLALTKKSGALQVDGPDGQGRVYWSDGAVIFATADVRRLALGARLVAAGVLSADQLREVAAGVSPGDPLALGAALLDGDTADDETVASFVSEQVHEAVCHLLRLEDGAFSFDGRAPVDVWSGPSFPVADVLAEGHRQVREWEEISASVPALDAPLSVVPTLPSAEVTITAEQWQLLALVDGVRTAKDLVELTGAGEFATCRLLADLVTEGLVEARTGDSPTALEQLLHAREALRGLERTALPGSADAADTADAADASGDLDQTSHASSNGDADPVHMSRELASLIPDTVEPLCATVRRKKSRTRPDQRTPAADDADGDDADGDDIDDADSEPDAALEPRAEAADRDTGEDADPAEDHPATEDVVAQDTADNVDDDGQLAEAAGERDDEPLPQRIEKVVSHPLPRDSGMSRSALLRLMNGIQSA